MPFTLPSTPHGYYLDIFCTVPPACLPCGLSPSPSTRTFSIWPHHQSPLDDDIPLLASLPSNSAIHPTLDHFKLSGAIADPDPDRLPLSPTYQQEQGSNGEGEEASII